MNERLTHHSKMQIVPQTWNKSMSDVGQFRKSIAATAESAFPSRADIIGQVGHVRNVPEAEVIKFIPATSLDHSSAT